MAERRTHEGDREEGDHRMRRKTCFEWLNYYFYLIKKFSGQAARVVGGRYESKCRGLLQKNPAAYKAGGGSNWIVIPRSQSKCIGRLFVEQRCLAAHINIRCKETEYIHNSL